MNQNSEERLGTAKMLPLVFKMAVPSVIAQLVNLLYSIVDRIYIGHIPQHGTDALAGIGITGSIIILISAFSSLAGGGGAPLAAIALGKDDRDRAEKILANCFTMLLFFAAVSMAAAYIFKGDILWAIGADSDTFGYADSYLSVYLLGTVFVMISVGLNGLITCQGRSGTAMISVVMGALINIVLDPIFIFVLKMDVAGAALATVISQACSAVFVLIFLFSKKATLRIRISKMAPDFRIIGAIAALGMAPFVMAATESMIGFVLNSGLQHYGGKLYVSALTVLQSVMQLSTVPLNGFGQGVSPIISYNFGAAKTERVKEAYKILLAVSFGFQFVMVLSMLVFPSFYAAMFTDDSMLIELVSDVMPLFMTGALIFGLQRACQNTFVALGQSKISLFIALLRKVILLIPLAIILPKFFGVNSIYLAESIADATAAIICITLFCIRFPKIMAKCEKSTQNIQESKGE